MGPVEVPADKYWGAQTQRSINNFKIGGEKNRMPIEIIKAFAILKKAAALTNAELGVLAQDKAEIIGKVCDEVLAGQHDDQFPLVIWQTASICWTRSRPPSSHLACGWMANSMTRVFLPASSPSFSPNMV